MKSKPTPADPAGKPESNQPAGEDPGTNKVEHQPDPDAKPIPDGDHKYIKRSPYTAGND
jgi:hypothetical protein